MKKLTIVDIAEMCGVGKSTVSRYLNNEKVSEKSRLKIEKVINETGFSPSKSAQNMRGSSNEVLILVQRIYSTSASRYIDQLVKKLEKHNLDPVIYTTELDSKKEDKYIKKAFDNNYQGIIIMSQRQKFNNLSNTQLKKIFMYGQINNNIASCNIDNTEVVPKLINKMFDKYKFDELVAIGVDSEDFAMNERVISALETAKKLKVKSSTIISSFYKEKDITIKPFNNKKYFFCVTDDMALKVYEECTKLNKELNVDYFLSGIGNSRFTKYLNISTVDIDYKQAANYAVEYLFSGNVATHYVDYEIIIY